MACQHILFVIVLWIFYYLDLVEILKVTLLAQPMEWKNFSNMNHILFLFTLHQKNKEFQSKKKKKIYILERHFSNIFGYAAVTAAAAAAAKSLQSCPTLCDPINSSPPGSPIPGILHWLWLTNKDKSRYVCIVSQGSIRVLLLSSFFQDWGIQHHLLNVKNRRQVHFS